MGEEDDYIMNFEDLCRMFRVDPSIVRARMLVAGWSLTKALVEPQVPDELEPPPRLRLLN